MTVTVKLLVIGGTNRDSVKESKEKNSNSFPKEIL
jgi:hypothetical protein